jgi:hypothetical protein
MGTVHSSSCMRSSRGVALLQLAQHLTPPCAVCLNLNAHSVSLPPAVDLQATFCLAGGALPTLNLDRLPVPLPNILLVGCVTGLGTHPTNVLDPESCT